MSAPDLAALSRLQLDYADCIDDDALERWPDFFTADGLYRITTADNEARGRPIGIVHAAGQAMMHDRIRALREANIFEAQRYRHVLSPPRWRPPVLTTSFLVVRIMQDGTQSLFACGRYRDRVVADDDGALRFAEKIVVLDSEKIDTLIAIPL